MDAANSRMRIVRLVRTTTCGGLLTDRRLRTLQIDHNMTERTGASVSVAFCAAVTLDASFVAAPRSWGNGGN